MRGQVWDASTSIELSIESSVHGQPFVSWGGGGRSLSLGLFTGGFYRNRLATFKVIPSQRMVRLVSCESLDAGNPRYGQEIIFEYSARNPFDLISVVKTLGESVIRIPNHLSCGLRHRGLPYRIDRVNSTTTHFSPSSSVARFWGIPPTILWTLSCSRRDQYCDWQWNDAREGSRYVDQIVL